MSSTLSIAGVASATVSRAAESAAKATQEGSQGGASSSDTQQRGLEVTSSTSNQVKL